MWGVGLRPQHYAAWAAWHAEHADAPYLEIMSDNLLGHRGGPGLWHTDRLAEGSPVLLHGIGLNIGSTDPGDDDYLRRLRTLKERYRPQVISDHLCFTRAGGLSSYELLPVSRTERTLRHLAERIDHVQGHLGAQISLENVSAYVAYREEQWDEGDFFSELARRTGCGVLLDVNNLFVNAYNFHLDAAAELAKFPFAAVTQVHVAGHTDCGAYLFDTHDQPVRAEVAALLRLTLPQLPAGTPVILECDDAATALPELLAELQRVRQMVEA